MKKIKLIFTLALIYLIMAAPCIADWAIVYDSENASDTANSVKQTPDGGYIVTGGGGGYWTLKLDSDGTVIWQNRYVWGQYALDEAQSITQTFNQYGNPDGYIVAGVDDILYDDSIGIVKLNLDGTINWQKKYKASSTSFDRAYSIQQTVDSEGLPDGYILTGSTIDAGRGWDMWVLRLNLDGTLSWQKAYSLYIDGAFSVQQAFDSNGNPDGFIVLGTHGAWGTGVWVLKIDSMGEVEWSKTYVANTADARSIEQTFDSTGNPDGYIVAGTSSYDVWILRLNLDGTINWQKTYGGTGNDYARCIKQTQDGNFVIAGQTSSFGAGGQDVWILKLDSEGRITWEKTYGGSLDDVAYSVDQTNDNGYILAGHTWSFGGRSMWVLKLSEDGEIPGCNAMGTSNATISNALFTLYTDQPIYPSFDHVISDTYVSSSSPIFIANAICEATAQKVHIDVMPKKCPNQIGTKNARYISVAILGTSNFDVSTVDTASVILEGVAPFRSFQKDVSAPVDLMENCRPCSVDGPDGILDLSFKFDKSLLLDALGGLPGDFQLELTGVLNDGTPIEGYDCVSVIQ